MIKLVDYVAIGRRVKFYRKIANLTQADVAERLGISVSYISQIECGHTDVSLKRLDEIASIINTNIELLLSVNSVSVNLYLNDNDIKELTKGWNEDQIKTLLEIINLLNKNFI